MKCDDFNDVVHIRPAKKEDMPAIASLIQELADFQNFRNGPKLSALDLQRDGFETTPPAFLLLVAENKKNDAIIGYALYFPTYSTWEGRAMLLEDLYVKPALRRQGVGRRLFNAVAKELRSIYYAWGSPCGTKFTHNLVVGVVAIMSMFQSLRDSLEQLKCCLKGIEIPNELFKKETVVCKVGLWTIILRDNVIRKPW